MDFLKASHVSCTRKTGTPALLCLHTTTHAGVYPACKQHELEGAVLVHCVISVSDMGQPPNVHVGSVPSFGHSLLPRPPIFLPCRSLHPALLKKSCPKRLKREGYASMRGRSNGST